MMQCTADCLVHLCVYISDALCLSFSDKEGDNDNKNHDHSHSHHQSHYHNVNRNDHYHNGEVTFDGGSNVLSK